MPISGSTATLLTFLSAGCLGFYAIYASLFHTDNSDDEVADVTARGKTNLRSIVFSFYAAFIGTWALTAFPEAGVVTGWGGVIGYLGGCVVPIIILAYLGPLLLEAMPNKGFTSLDFVFERFGAGTYVFVFIASFLVSWLGLCGSFIALGTAVGTVAHDSSASTSFVIIFVAGVTLFYSLLGGMNASLRTDKFAAASMMGLTLLGASTIAFKIAPYVTKETWVKAQPWSNRSGLACVILFISLTLVEISNQEAWQRVIASDSDSTAKNGLLLAVAVCFPTYLLFGCSGIYASAASAQGLVALDRERPYQAYFAILRLLPSPALYLVVIFSTILATACIDNGHNALLGIISGFCSRFDLSVRKAKMITLLVNIPAVIVALLAPPSILRLYIVGDVYSAAVFPILFLALWKRSTPWGAFIGACSGVSCIFCIGWKTLGRFSGGFEWFTFPTGYYTPQCLLTFCLAPLSTLIVGVAISELEHFVFGPRVLAAQQERLLQIKTGKVTRKKSTKITVGTPIEVENLLSQVTLGRS